MLISESYKNRLKELAGLISEEVDVNSALALSDSRTAFNLDLMTQAIEEGREVGILYKGDEMSAPSGKYRLVYPVAMGVSKAGNRVIRAIHKHGQSESKAKETGIRSAEVKNVWRLFKASNIKGMWLTGNFFQGPINGYNPSDKGMLTVEISTDLSKVKTFQEELFKKQKQEGEQQSKLRRFKDTGERPLEQPINNPETRISSDLENNNEEL